jgi:Ca2+-binding RTX toxin-like protein
MLPQGGRDRKWVILPGARPFGSCWATAIEPARRGDGDGSINGSNGPDLLSGGAGDDTVDGNVGADFALLGADDDTFTWDPGDGSDIVEGDRDEDTMRFNGSAGAEVFTASSNGGRLLFTRNVGNVVMGGNDTLDGGAGTDWIDGGAGTDTAANGETGDQRAVARGGRSRRGCVPTRPARPGGRSCRRALGCGKR